jgi:hypothetical protein
VSNSTKTSHEEQLLRLRAPHSLTCHGSVHSLPPLMGSHAYPCMSTPLLQALLLHVLLIAQTAAIALACLLVVRVHVLQQTGLGVKNDNSS